MKLHKSITNDRIYAVAEDAATSLESPGFCNACGADAYCVEPDAREYTCEVCDEPKVYGIDEFVMEVF